MDTFSAALSLYSEQLYAESLPLFQEAILTCPTDPRRHPCLAQTYMHLQDWPSAGHSLDCALQLDPTSPNLLCDLALVDLQSGFPVRAKEKLLEVLRRWPDFATALNCLGSLHVRMGLYREALKFFDQSQTLAPEDVDIHARRAEVLTRLGRHPEARQAWAASLQFAQQSGDLAAQSVAQTQLRLSDFSNPGIREEFYARSGSCLLGTFGDDGGDIHEYLFYNLAYSEVGTTIRRFLDLSTVFGWSFTACVPADKASGVLSQALSRLLEIPHRSMEALGTADFALLVAIRATVPQVSKLIEHNVGRVLNFALGFGSEELSPVQYPDICGVVCSVNVPWEDPNAPPTRFKIDRNRQICQAEKSDLDGFDEAVSKVLAEVRPREPNFAAQVRFWLDRKDLRHVLRARRWLASGDIGVSMPRMIVSPSVLVISREALRAGFEEERFQFVPGRCWRPAFQPCKGLFDSNLVHEFGS